MTALRGSACTTCGEVFWPAVEACPCCRSTTLTEHMLSGKGDVYTYTSVPDPGPRHNATAMLLLAIVHLSEGAYVQACVVDVPPAAAFIGMPVEAALEPDNSVASLGMISADGDRYTFRLRRSLLE